MFILDDLLLLPFRGVHWIAREIDDAAQQEKANEAQAITTELSELYKELESGGITEADFDAREKKLLDRLEEIEERTTRIESGNAEAQEDSMGAVRGRHRKDVNA